MDKRHPQDGSLRVVLPGWIADRLAGKLKSFWDVVPVPLVVFGSGTCLGAEGWKPADRLATQAKSDAVETIAENTVKALAVVSLPIALSGYIIRRVNAPDWTSAALLTVSRLVVLPRIAWTLVTRSKKVPRARFRARPDGRYIS